MNPVFSSREFWTLFTTLDTDLSDAEIAKQLDVLGLDYPIHEEMHSWERGGEKHSATSRFVSFTFACGRRFSLLVEYDPEGAGINKTLFLLDTRSGKKHELGWWDLVRWHPYCLRVEELQLLLVYWEKKDPRWADPELALLLLCDFIGFGDEQSLAAWQSRAHAALARLLPDPVQRPELELRRPDGDYRWSYDPGIPGWVFTSDEYCCYSTRNPQHLGSQEGVFPFSEWEQMLSQVQQVCSG